MPGANVFVYDGTAYKPTDRSQTAGIQARTSSAYTAVTYAYQLTKPASVTVSTQIWQGLPPLPSQVTFSHGTTGTAPNATNRTTISWTCDASTLLVRFELYQKIGTGSFTLVNSNIAAATRSYTVDSHAAGTLYTYYVRSVGISGLTRSGAENSFTLSAPTLTGVSVTSGSATPTQITWTATIPAGSFQKIDWYTGVSTLLYRSSTTLAAGTTSTSYTWTSLSENNTYYAAAILTNYSGHVTPQTSGVSGATTNAPPPAPTLSSITVVAGDRNVANWATSGEVTKSLTVNYNLSSDTTYKNHSVYLYSGADYPVTFIAWSGNRTDTGTGAKTQTFSGLSPSTKYWALVRQRDTYDAETDNATGWQPATTEAVQSYVYQDDPAYVSSLTYSEGGATFDQMTNIDYLSDGVYLASDYTGTLGGTTANAEDGNDSTYCAWRVVNGTYGSTSVGNIRFEMSDTRRQYLDFYVNQSELYFNQVKHNVAVQIRRGTAGSWLGDLAANSSITRNNDPIVYITPNNNSFTQTMNWGNIYGLGVAIQDRAAAGTVAPGTSGNANFPYWAMRFGIRNPYGSWYVHVAEYRWIHVYYTTESVVSNYTDPAPVYRYY
jgi:hypothetical protein